MKQTAKKLEEEEELVGKWNSSGQSMENEQHNVAV
jgi:hypothetical protein